MKIELRYGKCLRCDHEWVLRKLNPKCCPKCMSPYWDRPRREAKKEVENMKSNEGENEEKDIEPDRKVKGIFYKKEAYEAHLKKEGK